jgi:hypothetical protein
MENTVQTVTIPAGTGYNVEFNGNLTGDFDRATEPIAAQFIQMHGSNVIFRLPNGKRGMTKANLVEIA